MGERLSLKSADFLHWGVSPSAPPITKASLDDPSAFNCSAKAFDESGGASSARTISISLVFKAERIDFSSRAGVLSRSSMIVRPGRRLR